MRNLILFLGLFLFANFNYSTAKSNDIKPSFPGGVSALTTFLNDNVHYPEEANKNRMEGKTLVAFVVNEDGSISDIKIKKSSWPILDDEAKRVVQLMPKWMPAFTNGKKKKEMVILPILFDLKLINEKSGVSEKQ